MHRQSENGSVIMMRSTDSTVRRKAVRPGPSGSARREIFPSHCEFSLHCHVLSFAIVLVPRIKTLLTSHGDHLRLEEWARERKIAWGSQHVSCLSSPSLSPPLQCFRLCHCVTRSFLSLRIIAVYAISDVFLSRALLLNGARKTTQVQERKRAS